MHIKIIETNKVITLLEFYEMHFQVAFPQPLTDDALVEFGAIIVDAEPDTLEQRQAAAWEQIKQERDRRKYLGVKVGEHWFHSDDASRIQQISLFIMGVSVPPIPWKTLTMSPPPVFVNMSPEIASGIFTGTAASDAAIFAAAEAHRIAMEASDTPESYDFSVGWPLSIEDEA